MTSTGTQPPAASKSSVVSRSSMGPSASLISHQVCQIPKNTSAKSDGREKKYSSPKATLAPKDMTVAGRTIEVFNDHCFQDLRQQHDVPDNFLQDLRLSSQLPKISKGSEPIFRSDDEEFLVKAVNRQDHMAMLEICPDYVERCLQGSLLSPVYLHFRFTRDDQRKASKAGRKDGKSVDEDGLLHHLDHVAFVAMRNLTPNVGTWKARYDLKGCDDDKTIENEGHRIKAAHRRWWNFWYPPVCWNQERWIYWHSKQDAKAFRLPLPEEYCKDVQKILAEDGKWLAERGLMDYSLLIGVQRFHAPGGDSHEEREHLAEDDNVSVGRLSVLHAGPLPSSTRMGRNHCIFRETEVEKVIFVTLHSRQELEGGAIKLIKQQMLEIGLDPRDWEYEMEGVNKPMVSAMGSGHTTCSAVNIPALTPSPKAEFPRNVRVRLLKKNRDRPLVLVSICIIDFLQTWTCAKRCAAWLKACECNKATVHPDVYAQRFIDHFQKTITVDRTLVPTEGDEGPTRPPVVMPFNHRWINPGYG